jgi:cytochrome b subunit of formate dehydrogenase
MMRRVAAFLAALAAASFVHAAPEGLDNETCFGCHGQPGFESTVGGTKPRSLSIDRKVFEASVHAPRDCVNCHTYITQIPHDRPKGVTDAQRKLQIVNTGCGTCHSDNLKSYRDTYHGQVTALGYAYTAKCFDCHAKDSQHDIKRVADPASSVHPDNRLRTCQKCHANATPGFVTFQPHAHAHDFSRYPQVWITQKFMIQLLAGTFAFFWLHSALWFYREFKDRKQGKTHSYVSLEALPAAARGKHIRRFHWLWRLAHLVFALSLMVLTLTGMTVLYSQSAWAPYVARFFGGPQVTAIVHRASAIVFASIFFAHLGWMLVHIARHWKTFRFFGPNSLVPRWQDLADMIAMFKWFFGKGPRPVFDRWTYWEKFDYWAPFWGVTIIGASGFMLWFPELTATYLPGWVFNVAMIAHGEEAFLAAVFLFTVHFFNNHFRPDKFPIDILMFTGSMAVEEFAHDHTIEYKRLVESGELQKYLVDEPAKPLTVGSKILGFTLIAMGLSLLVLVLTGFVAHL